MLQQQGDIRGMHVFFTRNSINRKRRGLYVTNIITYTVHYGIYRVIQEESAILWEMIVCVILSKKVHMNMGRILNGYRDIVKRRYGPACEHEQQLRNK